MIKNIFYFLIIAFTLNSCSSNNITNEEGLKKYFEEYKVQGCFALYNNGQGNFNIYNLSRYKDSSYLPASTFKIVNSLIALQTGKLLNSREIVKWDGVKRDNESWNKDMSIEEAFKTSCVPFYQNIARRVGKDTMQIWLDSISYGTKKITTKVDNFWLDNSLKTKPDEQLGLVKKLYFEQLPFNKTTMQAVKQIMVQESYNKYLLAYKTGYGINEKGKGITWVVGWLEEEKHPSFFVLNFENDAAVDATNFRMKILMNCLHEIGYLKDKK